jgi:predicted DNA-binding protein YlxM (UPF0122 family)
MSSYLDSARLTERQYECASYYYEHKLTKAQIARHLRVHRSTVQECLASVDRKIEEAHSKQKSHKNLAKIKPGGLSVG